jgi:hypothetical protein
MNAKQLASQLLGTHLSSDHEREILRRLSAASPDPEEYSLVMALGKTGNDKYKGIMRAILDRAHDPMLSELALKSLLRWMDIEDDFRQLIESWLISSDEDYRLAGINLAPDSIRKHDGEKIHGLLCRLAKEESSPHLREAAVESLGRIKL